jgi:hypothetical protein
LILQGLSLFTPSSRVESQVRSAFAALSSLPGAEQAGTILCLNAQTSSEDGDSSGKAPVHRHDPGDCPMCQTVGCALAAVAAKVESSPPAPRELAPGFPPFETAPSAPPHYASSPRGPPSVV